MSAWDSKKTKVIHKFLHDRYEELNEMVKSPMNGHPMKNSIFKISDIPLSKLVEIDPDVIGNGSFVAFSKQYRDRNKLRSTIS